MVELVCCQVERNKSRAEAYAEVVQSTGEAGKTEKMYLFREKGEAGKYLGTATEKQVFWQVPMNTLILPLDDHIFLKARDYFRNSVGREIDALLVMDDGEPVATLRWRDNKIYSVTSSQNNRSAILRDYDALEGNNRSPAFLDYDFENHPVNDFTLGRAETFVFERVEEYSHAIALHILRHYPERQVYFLDEAAKLSIWGGHTVTVLKHWADLPRKSCMYITSGNSAREISNRPQYIDMSYSSKCMMLSMLWGSHITHPGDLYPDKTIVLIDTQGLGGLVDMMTLVCTCSFMAEMMDCIPVVDFSSEPSNRYYDEGKNAWEELFGPMNEEVTAEQARQCRNVIRCELEEGGSTSPIMQAMPEWREACNILPDSYFRSKTKLSDACWHVIIACAPAQLRTRLQRAQAEEKEEELPEAAERPRQRILGVKLRGTDYRKEIRQKGRERVYATGLVTMMEWVDAVFTEGKYTHIFLATEDEEYFKTFSEKFGEHLLYIAQPHVSYESSYPDAMAMVFEQGSPLTMTMLYMADLRCLSVCDALLSNLPSGGHALAVHLNQGRYELCHVVSDGESYPRKSALAQVLATEEKFVLCGMGREILALKEILQRQPERFVICSSDIMASLKLFSGVHIIKPDDIETCLGMRAVVTDQRRASDIVAALHAHGWDDSRIIKGFSKEIDNKFGNYVTLNDHDIERVTVWLDNWADSLRCRNLAIYPYGNVGHFVRRYLEQIHDIKVDLIVDNKSNEEGVIRSRDLQDMDCSEYYFLIASACPEIFKELRSELLCRVSENKILDMFAE